MRIKYIFKKKFSFFSTFIFLCVFSNKILAQVHGTGATVLSATEYAKLPKANWDTLSRYAPNNNGSGVVPYGLTNGITMLINPPIENQGSQNSCVGWAIGYTALGILTYPKYNCWGMARRSPGYIYNQIKVNGTGVPCGTSSFTAGLDLVKNQGDCSWNLMPYVDGDCSTYPNAAQQAEAAQNKALKWTTLSYNDVTGIKQALDLGYPVVISLEVFNSFNNLTNSNGGIWNANTGGSKGFNHATCIIGYDDTRQMFKAQNQWGTAWGDNGFFWIPYNFVQTNCLNGVYILYATNPLTPMSIVEDPKVCTTKQFSVSNLPTGSTISWNTNNAAVATVSSTGFVTKTGNGSVVLTATITNCGGTNPVIINQTLKVGGVVGYYTINSGPTQYNLVDGSGSSVTANRGQQVSFFFTITSNNISAVTWHYDNISGTSTTSFVANITAPSTGYTSKYTTVYLDATTPCGVIHYSFPFSVMSLGWSFAATASPNPAQGNISLAITEVADTISVSSTTLATQKGTSASNTTNVTKVLLYDINTNILVKQWIYNEAVSPHYSLNIAGIKSGMYILKVERDNKSATTKILIQ